MGAANAMEESIPGECMGEGVAVPSTLTACCSAGSEGDVVADMLMHRAAAAEDVCAVGVRGRQRLLQGAAAGRSMAVPVNWRVDGRGEGGGGGPAQA